MTIPLRVDTQTKPFDSFYVEPEIEEATRGHKILDESSLEETGLHYLQLTTDALPRGEGEAKQIGWWFGSIENVYEDYFTAVMEDLHGKISAVEFDFKEIREEDHRLVEPNIRFSYSVTQIDNRSGRFFQSKLSLSSPSFWSERDSERAKKSIEELFPGDFFEF